MTARLAIVIVPVSAMEGIARACEEGTPRHARQTINALFFHRIALIGHMDRGSFMICTELALGSVCASHAACTTLRKKELLSFKGGDQLRAEIDDDPFLIIRHFGREDRELLVWNQAHVMRWHIIRTLEIEIINLIPDAFFIALDDHFFHPMRAAIVDAIPALCIGIRLFLGIAKRDGDLY